MGHPAANPAVMLLEWSIDGTDRQTPYCCMDPAAYSASSVSNVSIVTYTGHIIDESGVRVISVNNTFLEPHNIKHDIQRH